MVPREGFGWMNCMLTFWISVRVLFTYTFLFLAAYQVGLSFLTTHMRRAVAACTSPEVFFGSAASRDSALLTNNVSAPDMSHPLGLAMEALNISPSRQP